MDFLAPELQTYIQRHTAQESPVLAELARETYAKVLMPRMLSGHLQGRVLAMLAKMAQPKTILEIGTYTGYSAICLAEGLLPGGTLYTIDINEELEDMARSYFDKAGLTDTIRYTVGDAMAHIPLIDDTFDLVFIDADKLNYPNYYDLVIDKVPAGGYIIADNVLWSGKVVERDAEKMDEDTRAIIDFNDKVHHDARVENVLFPVRDGLMILRKR